MRGFQALCSQSDQFLPFHSDKKFSALGFGARIPPNYEVSQGTCVKQDQWGQNQWLGGGSAEQRHPGSPRQLAPLERSLASVPVGGWTSSWVSCHHTIAAASCPQLQPWHFLLFAFIRTPGLGGHLSEVLKGLLSQAVQPQGPTSFSAALLP